LLRDLFQRARASARRIAVDRKTQKEEEREENKKGMEGRKEEEKTKRETGKREIAKIAPVQEKYRSAPAFR